MKKSIPVFLLPFFIFTGAFMGGCNEVWLETAVIISPYMVTSDGDTVSHGNFVVHAFYVDTDQWEVSGYDSAYNALIRRKGGVASESPAPVVSYARPDGNGKIYVGPVTETSVMLIAALEDAPDGKRYYAWRKVEPKENFGHLYLNLFFRIGRTGTTTDSGWSVVSPDKEETAAMLFRP